MDADTVANVSLNKCGSSCKHPPYNLNRVPELVYGGVDSAYMDGCVNTNSTFLAHGYNHRGHDSQT